MEKDVKLMVRWSIFSSIIVAVFWGIWYLITGSIPVSANLVIPSGQIIQLSFISRLWDIPFIAVYSSMFVYLCTNTDHDRGEDNTDFALTSILGFILAVLISNPFVADFFTGSNVTLIIGTIVTLIIGLIVALIVGMIMGLFSNLIIKLTRGLVFCLFYGLGISLFISIKIGFLAALVLGLSFGGTISLAFGSSFIFGSVLRYLFSKDFSRWLSAKEFK